MLHNKKSVLFSLIIQKKQLHMYRNVQISVEQSSGQVKTETYVIACCNLELHCHSGDLLSKFMFYQSLFVIMLPSEGQVSREA